MAKDTSPSLVHLPPMSPMRCTGCQELWPCESAQAACPAGHGRQCCGFTEQCREALSAGPGSGQARG